MYRLETIHLGPEAMRSCDIDGLDQEVTGLRIVVSRGTVQRLLKSGRTKTPGVWLQSRTWLIEEGAHHEDLCTD